ncbi:uncharacterized protein LOC119669463 [Teleopsis dalmanni]|uniref:uncharacterized protein LOC119669463 n=1 Tax=Teleopsis dalmanni TaxID=139649 RepID=UPI0018CDDED9|nr:uncharacterized protein LOC119669463 [Teleopsis dalmanni]
METGIEFDLKLIEFVKANPILYQRELRVTPYQCIKEKTEIWKSIAVSLKTNHKEVIMRWKNLREKYLTMLKNERTSNQPKSPTNKDPSAKTNNAWPLYEKMHFLLKHNICYGLNTKSAQQDNKKNTAVMDAELLSEDEDIAIQEAMEEQAITTSDKVKFENNAMSTAGQADRNMSKSIEALFATLEGNNRNIAQKRILEYLCKCNLKALKNESIEDIVI